MRTVLNRLVIAAIATVGLAAPVESQGRKGYYRHPALYGDTIVFAAEGDLWKASTAGGLAQRLTTHAAEESHPTISPDGSTLAFTGRYEGPSEVYTMPLAGGLPTRHTYEADRSTPIGWTPGGELLYTTTAYATLPNIQMVSLRLDDGTSDRLPLWQASEGSFSGDGETLFFVRPAFHNNVTKRYVGGTARKIWKFARGAAEAQPLTTDYDGESHTPMWWNGRIYFVSPRDGTMNLWSMDEDGGNATQHTLHSGWDVKEASLQAGRIVYQVGADLWIYDIAADNDRMIDITLASDFDQLREKWVDDPMQYLTSAHIHPDGDSIVLTSRGRVFVAPAGDGRFVRASRKEGVRYRDVVFMPDGETLLGLSDETSELEFVSIPANGIGAERALTDDGDILRFRGVPSPDGRWVLFTDNNSDLNLLEVASGDIRTVSTNQEGVGSMSWAPDSRWFAYSQAALNSYSQLWLYNADDDTRVEVTSDRTNSTSATWSPDGKWLYFLSDRNLRTRVGSPWGPRAPEPFFDSTWKIYEVALQKGLRSPFKPDDELADGSSTDADDEPDSADEAEGEADDSIDIDIDGIQHRVREVPVAPGNYGGLVANDGALFWISRPLGEAASVMAINRDNGAEPVAVAEGIRGFELALNGDKMMVRRGNDFFVIDARARRVADLSDARVDLSDWEFSIDVAEDWRQIFVDAWRLERDYFYDPGMHGVAWDVVLEKYMPLVARVTTREELSDLIGRVVGELSALHTSVRGGDLREGEDQIAVPGLGARLMRDPAAGGYRVDYIYQSDPDYPERMSPLGDSELGVANGDVIEAVNGVPTLDVHHIGVLLRNQQGKQVLLTVRSGASGESRDMIVVPTTNERNMRYSDWEYTRRLAVEEQGQGEIGYVHLRAMGAGDINSWYEQFYPVFNRRGLILDMRYNRGGNIDSIILEKLMRQAWMYWKTRTGEPYWNMQYAFRGHMVVLVDENTASDGEAFADGFRRLELGPVIGTRTWGGEIWLSSVNRLSDGGLARAPMMGVYGPEGEWLIEGWGLEPDVVVDNLPHATFNGADAQLDAAIEYLLEQIAADPRDVPAAPAYPNKDFRYPDRRITNGQGSGPGSDGQR